MGTVIQEDLSVPRDMDMRNLYREDTRVAQVTTAAAAARQFLQWTGLKPHSTNGLPGCPLHAVLCGEWYDFVFKGERGSAEVTITKDALDDQVILVLFVLNHEESGQMLFAEQSSIELGEKIRAQVGPILFDGAERFRVQGTEHNEPTPWGAIMMFFDCGCTGEDDFMGAAHEVDVEALEPVRLSSEWLSNRASAMVDTFAEDFESRM